MNNIIADNAVRTLKKYLTEKLSVRYDEREAGNVVQLLFQEFLGWSKADVILKQDDRISESEMLKFHFALKRLLAGEPLQYITGHEYFCGFDFKVDSNVLIPRPETEELVQMICAQEKRTAPRVLDVGTGSGCIAIGLKLLKPVWRVEACDVSAEALAIATANAKRLEAHVTFKQMDILTESPDGQFDVLVSNPPYIPRREAESMSVQVKQFEPDIALFVDDEDPLIFYRRILWLASTQLQPGGSVWFEIHEDSKEALISLMQSMVNVEYHFHQDMQGKDRILQIRFID
ncbi:MAG: peptide chain release factor N(5)-glutamine methyltransferase [Flavobacteriales bacterium]|nr:peptide chain release factor N(5)-glutamine methyltransferase [Flavobacteriales bacterium]